MVISEYIRELLEHRSNYSIEKRTKALSVIITLYSYNYKKLCSRVRGHCNRAVFSLFSNSCTRVVDKEHNSIRSQENYIF